MEPQQERRPIINPFIENVRRFIGREVVVRVFTPTGVLEFKGFCEALEFQYKTVIIRNATETIMIPHYMSISRARSHPEDAKKALVAIAKDVEKRKLEDASSVKVRKDGPKKD
jgi:hypothetical protein